MTATTETRATGDRHFRARRLAHANLYVRDLARSIDFYHRVVGLERTYSLPVPKAGFLSNGASHHDIGLVELGGPTARKTEPGLNHFGFELENETDLVAGYRAAVGAGVNFYRTVNHPITHSLYVFDPDENSNEIYADVTTDWRTARGTTPTQKWTPGETPPSPERNYDPDPVYVRVAGAMFQPLRITHATVVGNDFEGLFDHYTRVVGLTPIVGGRGAPFAALAGACGFGAINLFRAVDGQAAGLHHIGFEMANDADLDAGRRSLPRTGAAKERDVDHPLRRSTFVRDPDGMMIAFYVNRPNWRERLGSLDAATALWVA